MSAAPQKLPPDAFERVLFDNRLAHGAKLLWMVLRLYINRQSGLAYPGWRLLIHRLGCSDHSLLGWKNQLVEFGYLKIRWRKIIRDRSEFFRRDGMAYELFGGKSRADFFLPDFSKGAERTPAKVQPQNNKRKSAGRLKEEFHPDNSTRLKVITLKPEKSEIDRPLTPKEMETAELLSKVIGSMHDFKKWRNRIIAGERKRVESIFLEIRSMKIEGKIKKTASGAAEDLWKRGFGK